MDVVLEVTDTYFFDAVYRSLPPFTSETLAPYFVARDSIPRQCLSLWLVTWFFGVALYFMFATLSYRYMFDKELEKHPKFLKNQVGSEFQDFRHDSLVTHSPLDIEGNRADDEEHAAHVHLHDSVVLGRGSGQVEAVRQGRGPPRRLDVPCLFVCGIPVLYGLLDLLDSSV
jgi:hypothetical protein